MTNSENTMVKHKVNEQVLEIKRSKTLEYLYKLDILSQMDIFEGLTLKNLRDLLEVA